jgi:hypothetical protein
MGAGKRTRTGKQPTLYEVCGAQRVRRLDGVVLRAGVGLFEIDL